jgi:hypothetical protein
MLNKNLLLILLVLILSVVILADVPPARNEIRIDVDLAFTPRDDFADYRFFLASGNQLEEITLKKDVPSIIKGENRGGMLRRTILIAIPKAILQDKAKLSDDEQEKIVVSIYKKDNNNYIELLKHSFQEDIPIGERVDKIYPKYELKREGNLPKAFEGQGISKKTNEEEEETITFAKYEKATIIAGILMALAFVFVGTYIFRKTKK